MSVLFSDVLQNIDDLCQNYTNSTIDKGNKQRAANRAIEYVQRRLGLPSDKKVYSFYFYEDIQYYDCQPYFNELLKIYYNTSSVTNSNKNIYDNEWDIKRDTDILQSSGTYPRRNAAAFTTLNGANQILMNGRNLIGRSILNSFDSLTGLTYSTDISSAGIDNNVHKEGSGSLKFNIASGLTETVVSFPVSMDIRLYQNIGSAYRIYIDFPTGTKGYFTALKFRLQSSTGNYYEVLGTVVDNAALVENAWNFYTFDLASATLAGSPNAASITSVSVVLPHSGTFAPVVGIRLDYLYQINPDLMDVVYFTSLKGTDTTGNTDKQILTQDNDICSFGEFAPDLIDPIAMRAALRLFPQLRGDKDFWQMYKTDFDDVMKVMGRVYPRQRATGNFGQTSLNR